MQFIYNEEFLMVTIFPVTGHRNYIFPSFEIENLLLPKQFLIALGLSSDCI
jgi:hypothetical protein